MATIYFHPMQSSENCVICNNSMSDKQCLGHSTDKVNHIFHENCLRSYYAIPESEHRCPICQDIVPILEAPIAKKSLIINLGDGLRIKFIKPIRIKKMGVAIVK